MIDQILAGAERAFLAQGYDLTTMDSVARHAGVARGSVYNHFDSKEALFLAMMQRGIADFVDRATSAVDTRAEPLDRIADVASGFLRAAVQPGSIGMYRTVVALGERFPELPRILYRAGLATIEQRLAEIAALDGSGAIARPDAFARHLIDLMMGGLFQRRLLGIADHPADVSIEAQVRELIAALL